MDLAMKVMAVTDNMPDPAILDNDHAMVIQAAVAQSSDSAATAVMPLTEPEEVRVRGPDAAMTTAHSGQAPEDGISRILQTLPFSPEEFSVWTPRIRQMHQGYVQEMRAIAKDADDPTFYEISIREAKLFIEEFMLQFRELTADPKNAAKTREVLLEMAFVAAQGTYQDIMPPSRRITKDGVALDQTTDILQWTLRRHRPVLIVRSLKGFDLLERGWARLEQNNPDLVRHTLTGTPATDYQQIIGARMPSQPTSDGRQILEFRPGLITRLADIARRDPAKTYVIQIDNLEAIPAKVRNSINISPIHHIIILI